MEAAITDINSADWTEADASNTSTPPNGWPSTTMLPSQVEPAARAIRGAIKRWHDQISPTLTSGGTANAQTLTHTVAHTALVAGDLFSFLAGFTNTGATTLNVDALGAIAVKIGTTALQGGEIQAGQMILVGYDGTQFQLLRAGQPNGQQVATNANDSAAAGRVGEIAGAAISAGSAVALTSTVPANVTSMSLTAGDWEITGLVAITGNTGTLSQLSAGASTVSATLPAIESGVSFITGSFAAPQPLSLPLMPIRGTFATTTTVYLVASATMTGNAAVYGALRARRAR